MSTISTPSEESSKRISTMVTFSEQPLLFRQLSEETGCIYYAWVRLTNPDYSEAARRTPEQYEKELEDDARVFPNEELEQQLLQAIVTAKAMEHKLEDDESEEDESEDEDDESEDEEDESEDEEDESEDEEDESEDEESEDEESEDDEDDIVFG